MRGLGFTAESYFKGTKKQDQYKTVHIKDMDAFQDCFRRWKEMQHLEDGQAQSYLSSIENLIDQRIKAIVSGQYRNHYRSAAALAAALGEVKESAGKSSARQDTMLKYQNEFPRHSSFCGALMSFGMKKVRKR